MLLVILAATAAVTSALPSYIAVPSDQIAFVDLRALHLRRIPRQTLEPPPPPQLPQALYQNQEYLPQYQGLQNQYKVSEADPNDQQEYSQQYQGIPIPVQQYAPIPIQLAPQPQQQQSAPLKVAQNEEPSSSASQFESRPPDFGEYVDFGAHTGDNGAFGWYADYPINNHEDPYRRK